MSNFKTFDEVLRMYLDRMEERHSKTRDNDWWFASELGMCLRKCYIRRLGLQNTEEKEFRIRFLAEDGNACHRWRQDATQAMGVLVEKEGTLTDEKLRYKGRFDLIVQLKDGKSIIDIKTQRPEAFFRRAKKPVGERVEEFQKLQLASYVYFGRKRYPDIKDARIYYVDRGGGVREEFIFHFQQTMFDKILGELQLLNKFWAEGQLPPKDDRKWVCRYCPYTSICTKVTKDNLTINQIKEIYGRKKDKRFQKSPPSSSSSSLSSSSSSSATSSNSSRGLSRD